MKEYTDKDVLRLAKRVNNTKRTFLLVNPLQAKHIPVRPSVSLEMMKTLGQKLAAKYPDTRLIVGFAETATAIGAAVASCFPGDCLYMHTTREALPQVKDWILFQEEHSHATEQKLAAEGFLKGLNQTGTVLFIEDEISTGRTLRNMICQLRELVPEGSHVQMVAASIINRMSEANENLLRESGIVCECLVRVPEEDYSAQLEHCAVECAASLEREDENASAVEALSAQAGYPDPRLTVSMSDYSESLRRITESAAGQISGRIPAGARLLVLGTEECMYPALVLGEAMEEHCGGHVFCHSTTRSPIGIKNDQDYPIRNGHRMNSLYQDGRNTHLYNFAAYDAAVVVSDAGDNADRGLAELAHALTAHGTSKIFFLKL